MRAFKGGMLVYNLDFTNEVYYDYFMYKGNKYPLNTVFVPTKEFKNQFKFCKNEMLIIEHGYDNNAKKEFYVIVYNHNEFGDPCYRKVYNSPDGWVQSIVRYVNPNEKHYMCSNDSEVDIVVYGWIIYIALMLLLAIFNGRVVAWFIVSVFFFNWRKKKLRKEKKYDY